MNINERSYGRRLVLFACSAALLTMGVAGCGDDGSSTEGSGGGSSAGETVQVAHFTAFLGSPFEQASLAASKAQAQSMNGEVTNFDAGNDPQKQLQQCQDAIATQRYEAFVLKPVDGAAAASCAREAIEAGIEVVALDTPVGPDESKIEAQVDGIAGSVVHLPQPYGKALADMTVEACEGKDPCNVIYLFGPPAFSFIANAREVFKEEIAKSPNIKIVAEESTEFVPDTAQSVTKQLLQTHPDTHVITDDDDATAVAILRTLEEAGKKGDITVIGGGGAEEALELIRKGEIFGTAVLTPRSEAEKAVTIAINAVNGEETPDSFIEAGALSPIGAAATEENAGQFEAEWTVTG